MGCLIFLVYELQPCRILFGCSLFFASTSTAFRLSLLYVYISLHSKSFLDLTENPECVSRKEHLKLFISLSNLDRIWSMREISVLPLTFNSYILVGKNVMICGAGLAVFTSSDINISSE